MKIFLFLFLFLLFTCQEIEDNLFIRNPSHPLKKFYDDLKENGTSQKLRNAFVEKGKFAAFELCIELVPEIPKFITRYFSTNREFCSVYIDTLN